MIVPKQFKGYKNVWTVVGCEGIQQLLRMGQSQVEGVQIFDRGDKVPQYSLDFLLAFPELKFLTVDRYQANDISLIANLNKIEVLGLFSPYSDDFDFSNLTNLKYLHTNSNGKLSLDTVNADALEVLYINYATKETFHNFDRFNKLKSIELWDSKIPELSTILQSESLRQLVLRNNSFKNSHLELTDRAKHILAGLRILDLYLFRYDPHPMLSNCRDLLRLYVNSCSKLHNLSFVKNLPHLQTLYLRNCRDIDSLSPIIDRGWIDDLTIIANTKIVDKNLKGLENVKMKHKPFIASVKNYELDLSVFNDLPLLPMDKTEYDFLGMQIE